MSYFYIRPKKNPNRINKLIFGRKRNRKPNRPMRPVQYPDQCTVIRLKLGINKYESPASDCSPRLVIVTFGVDRIQQPLFGRKPKNLASYSAETEYAPKVHIRLLLSPKPKTDTEFRSLSTVHQTLLQPIKSCKLPESLHIRRHFVRRVNFSTEMLLLILSREENIRGQRMSQLILCVRPKCSRERMNNSISAKKFTSQTKRPRT